MNLLKDTEQQILDMFHHDVERAMAMLYHEYAGCMAGVCARYMADETARKDVLQESFIKIYMQLGAFEYRGKGSLKAWMTRIVVNEALQHLRKEKAAGLVMTDAEPPDTIEEEPDVGHLTADELLLLLQKLPSGYRTVFNLYAIEGKSHKEIAALLGIKATSSASQFHHAKAMMAKLITEYKQKHVEQ